LRDGGPTRAGGVDFHYGQFTVRDVKTYLKKKGIAVRI
jgi:imidazole glycerol phosphate synthase subunit HisF